MFVLKWNVGIKSFFLFLFVFLSAYTKIHSEVPDFTQGGEADFTYHDWNLGPTGARGWIWGEHFSTEAARQILVTEVLSGSPAHGRLQVDDVIIGVNGANFTEDARVAFGNAVSTAEQTANQGQLNLRIWRNGVTSNVTIPLTVMGSGATKAQSIVTNGCAQIVADGIHGRNALEGAVNALALMASGDSSCDTAVRNYAREIADNTNGIVDSAKATLSTWTVGYMVLFLAEYKIKTNDTYVNSRLNELALWMANGQGPSGLWGHRNVADFQMLRGYGGMAQPSISAALGLQIAKLSGVSNAKVNLAIERTKNYLLSNAYVACIPYGAIGYEGSHDHNGRNALAAIYLDLLNEHDASHFYAKTAIASHGELEGAHTGNYLAFLWAPLGALRAGTEAHDRFVEKLDWFFSFERRYDGSFLYQGGAHENPMIQNNIAGWMTTSARVLMYSPKGGLYITGKNRNAQNNLTGNALNDVLAAGDHHSYLLKANEADPYYDTLTKAQLLQQLSTWSYYKRNRVAHALSRKADISVNDYRSFLQSSNRDTILGGLAGLEALGSSAEPILDDLTPIIDYPDYWVRARIGELIRSIGSHIYNRDAVKKYIKHASDDVPGDVRGLHQQYAASVLFKESRHIVGILKNHINEAYQPHIVAAMKKMLHSNIGSARRDATQGIGRLTTENRQPILADVEWSLRNLASEDQGGGTDARLKALGILKGGRFTEGMSLGIDYLDTIVHQLQNDGNNSPMDNMRYFGAKDYVNDILHEWVNIYGTALTPYLNQLKSIRDVIRDDPYAYREVDQADYEFFSAASRNYTVGILNTAIADIEAATTAPEVVESIQVYVDTTPPTPNPSFSTNPTQTSSSNVHMVANTVSDSPAGGVEYYFTEISGSPGGDDSGWQSSSEYTDEGLQIGQQYSYKIKTRDRYLNVSVESPTVSVSVQQLNVAVPNVVSMTQSAATTALTNIGLLLGSTSEAFSDTFVQGSVISQDPTASTTVEVGSSVNLVISRGPSHVQVPDVVSLTQSQAQTAITNINLQVGTVSESHSTSITAGLVISQSPVASTTVAVESSVDIEVSLGPAPVIVPNVVSSTQSQAESTITNAGLLVGNVSDTHSDSAPFGTVISQTPASSSSVDEGSSVDLVISLGPEVPLESLAGQLGILDVTANNGINPATGIVWKIGDTYRLVFVSSTKRTVEEDTLSTYDQYLTDLASTAGVGGSWKVMGSSATTDAKDHTSSNPSQNGDTTPVLLINGTTIIANNYTDLWNDDIQNAINHDENGNNLGEVSVHTGSNANGTKRDRPLGGHVADNKVSIGNSNRTNSNWFLIFHTFATTPEHLYAMSVPLTVKLKTDDVSVPDVLDFPQSLAETVVNNANLQVGTITEQNSDTIATGNVISQNPAPASSIASGSSVDLVISLGPATVQVPNLSGLTQTQAESAVSNANLTMGSITSENNSTIPVGQVISQTPSASTTVYQGSQVSIVISLGIAEVSVPDVVNLTQAQAETSLNNAGLSLGAVSNANHASVPAGQVISQTPAASSMVSNGSSVDIVVSLGIAQVQVPNVVNLTQAQAESAISNVGLLVGSIDSAHHSNIPTGSVISQTPSASSSVAEASSINLVISLGPEMVEVPNVVQMTESQARSQISTAGLSVSTVSETFHNSIPRGTVISQSPSAPSRVIIGSNVELVVSLGPDVAVDLLAGELGVLNMNANNSINPGTGQTWRLGDTYRLVFVSSAKTSVEDDSLSTYDAFLNELAQAANLGDGWQVLGSSATTDARDHTSTSPNAADQETAILLIDGIKIVANNYSDLWDGSLDYFINTDEQGNTLTKVSVHTGTNSDGTKRSRPLGGSIADNKVTIGATDRISGQWMVSFNTMATTPERLYAISKVLKIGLKPEPVIVPNVISLAQSQAQNTLANHRLVVGNVSTSHSDTVAEGHVISQSPQANSSVAVGSVINIVISLGPANVLVPNIVSLTQAQAESSIQSNGLSVGNVTTENSDGVEAGRVISQSPSDNSSVLAGSSVNFVVSLGPVEENDVSVPNVLNQTETQARSLLTNVGLSLGTVSRIHSDTVAEGAVISQNPSANSSVTAGSSVNLVISLGPEDINVPNVVSMSQTQAENTIRNIGLNPGSISLAHSDTVALGQVISQSPGAATSVSPGTTINLVISLGPGDVEVPNVVSLTQTQAQNRINNAGLELGVINSVHSDTIATGTVISQSPVASTMLAPGSSVDLVISQGPEMVQVPSLNQVSESQAGTLLESIGLKLGSSSFVNHDVIVSGDIVSQHPIASAQVEVGTEINVIVSLGPVAPPSTTLVSVPNVLSSQESQAVQLLSAAGLAVGVKDLVFSQTVVEGQIVRQDPEAGTNVTAGSNINLVVSLGKAPVNVPNVANMSLSSARSTIESLGLQVGNLTNAHSSQVAQGAVMNQSPVASTSVNQGASVDLVVSLGSVVVEVPTTVIVPSIIALGESQAIAVLSSSKLSFASSTLVFSESVESGKVISQTPVSSTIVSEGSSVSLIVSKGSSKVSVPNVILSSQAQAEAAIINEDLSVGTIIASHSNDIAAGLVMTQSPSEQTRVERGSAVDLVVSIGPAGSDENSKPGLWFSQVSGDINLTASNLNTLLVDDVASKTEDQIDSQSTEIFTGEIFDADGQISFTEHIAGKSRVFIDGNLVLTDDNASARQSTTNLNLSPGWHAIEIRISNGTGGSGPVERPGVGFDVNGGANFSTLKDPGDGSLLRVTLSAGTTVPSDLPESNQSTPAEIIEQEVNTLVVATSEAEGSGVLEVIITNSSGMEMTRQLISFIDTVDSGETKNFSSGTDESGTFVVASGITNQEEVISVADTSFRLSGTNLVGNIVMTSMPLSADANIPTGSIGKIMSFDGDGGGTFSVPVADLNNVEAFTLYRQGPDGFFVDTGIPVSVENGVASFTLPNFSIYVLAEREKTETTPGEIEGDTAPPSVSISPELGDGEAAISIGPKVEGTEKSELGTGRSGGGGGCLLRRR